MFRDWFLLLLSMSALPALGQIHPDSFVLVRKMLLDGDTINVYTFDEYVMERMRDAEAEKRYLRLVRDLKKTMPYAKMVGMRLQIMEDNIALISSKKERKSYVKATQKAIIDEFTDDLKNLTRNQGRLLIKLIHRETGKTPHDLLSEYTGGVTTMFWSAAANYYGGNLKETYDPTEDYYIEYIIKSLQLE